MIEVERLRKEYSETVAVTDSTFSVPDGEVFGIIGPNGAGKTTTLKMLAGLIEPTSGSATVAGYDSTDREMRTELGFLPEESPLYDEMTPRSYLRFFADLYDVPREVADERIDSVLTRLELDVRTRPIGNLSKGMTRKVAIARSLINDPSVLIYDEPASGLDPLTTNKIIEFTKELSEQGKTIVFSAHNLYHVETVCDRVAMMSEGEIITSGAIEEIRDQYSPKQYHVVTNVPVPGSEQQSESRYTTTVDTMDEVLSLQQSAEAVEGELIDIDTTDGSLEEIFLEVTAGDAPPSPAQSSTVTSDSAGTSQLEE